MEKLADRVAWAITKIKEEFGHSNVRIGELLGIDKNTVAAYLNMTGSLKGEVLEGLANQFNYNSDWLLKNWGEPFPGARDKYEDVCGPTGGDSKYIQEQQDGEYVLIPQINGKISAGNGLAPDNTADIKVAFRREWIKRKGDPDKMSLIKVEGDSMDPTILSGDLVLVDHNRNYVAPQGGIYALSINHEIMIKRIHPLHSEGKLRIISDNRQYEPIEIEAEKIKINGKVIWFAREIDR